jgi:predicted dinucleotide-utilizing enzyme
MQAFWLLFGLLVFVGGPILGLVLLSAVSASLAKKVFGPGLDRRAAEQRAEEARRSQVIWSGSASSAHHAFPPPIPPNAAGNIGR